MQGSSGVSRDLSVRRRLGVLERGTQEGLQTGDIRVDNCEGGDASGAGGENGS